MKHIEIATNPQRNTWVLRIGSAWFGVMPTEFFVMIFRPVLFVRRWKR